MVSKSDMELKNAAMKSERDLTRILEDRLSRSLSQSFPGVHGKPNRPIGKPKKKRT